MISHIRTAFSLLFRVLQILIAILIGWAVCGILTATDVIPNDKNSTTFYTRTDARSYVLETSSWFYWPYPGQHLILRSETDDLKQILPITINDIKCRDVVDVQFK